jgi:hypothetical protein
MGALVLAPAEKGRPVEDEYTLAFIFPGKLVVFNAIVVFEYSPIIPLEIPESCIVLVRDAGKKRSHRGCVIESYAHNRAGQPRQLGEGMTRHFDEK